MKTHLEIGDAVMLRANHQAIGGTILSVKAYRSINYDDSACPGVVTEIRIQHDKGIVTWYPEQGGTITHL